MALDHDDFLDPPTRPRGPRHAARVDPEQAADIERRMATLMARRLCNRHACTGADCTHENHRKDVDALHCTDPDYPGLLDFLGLPHEYPEITEQDRTVWLTWLRQAGPPEADLRDAA